MLIGFVRLVVTLACVAASLLLPALSGCSSQTIGSTSTATTPTSADPVHTVRDVDAPFSHVYHFKTADSGHINGTLKWLDKTHVMKLTAKFDKSGENAICSSSGGHPSTIYFFDCNGGASAWVTVTAFATELSAAETYRLDVTIR